MTLIERIRKRIKTREMMEGTEIDEVQITEKEAKELNGLKKIDNVRLIVVEELRDMAKKDCFAYMKENGKRSCYALNRLYCANRKCNFYRNDIIIEEIEKSIIKYSNGGTKNEH